MNISFPLLLDGAMGTQLYKRGFPAGECPEKWSLEHPEKVLSIQRAYVDAGSQVIYAPTFGANSSVLEKNGVCARGSGRPGSSRRGYLFYRGNALSTRRQQL